MARKKKHERVTVYVHQLLGKPVKGITVQITNPKYFRSQDEKWRKLISVQSEIDKKTGVEFLYIRWEARNLDGRDENGYGYSGVINDPKYLGELIVQLHIEDYKLLFK